MSKYLRNEHYFEVIDSEAKAYIVGFIAADGALVKSAVRLYFRLTTERGLDRVDRLYLRGLWIL